IHGAQVMKTVVTGNNCSPWPVNFAASVFLQAVMRNVAHDDNNLAPRLVIAFEPQPSPERRADVAAELNAHKFILHQNHFRRNVNTCAGSKPGLTSISLQKLFTSSEAPIRSMSARVSSLTIKVLRTRAKPWPLLRAPDFNAGSTFTRAAFHAGNNPKRMVAMKIVPAEKVRTGTSTPISSMRAITPAPIALNAATAQ